MPNNKEFIFVDGITEVKPDTDYHFEAICSGYLMIVRHHDKNILVRRWDEIPGSNTQYRLSDNNPVYKATRGCFKEVLDYLQQMVPPIPKDEVTITVHGGQPCSENTAQAIRDYQAKAAASFKVEIGDDFRQTTDDEMINITVSETSVVSWKEAAIGGGLSVNGIESYSDSSEYVDITGISNTDEEVDIMGLSEDEQDSPNPMQDSSDDEQDSPSPVLFSGGPIMANRGLQVQNPPRRSPRLVGKPSPKYSS